MLSSPARYLVLAAVLLICLAPLAACGAPQTEEGQATSIGSTPTLAPPDRSAAARRFVELVEAGDLAEAASMFDATMTQALPTEQLGRLWTEVETQAGAFKEMTGTRQEQQQGYDVVFVTTAFERATLDIKVVFDAQGRIAGLFFLPPGTATPSTESDLPDYIQRDSFEELEVTIGEGEWVLPGTLSLPKGAGPSPVVVLVHGSGPNDRDETIGPNKPFRDLAWGLASRGIAVLRYEKRTKIYGEKMQTDPGLTVREETIDDALAAVRLLRQREDIDPDRIFVLGHSLGGMLAPRIGAADPDIAGLIVLAGLTRPLEDTVIDQFTYIFSLDGTISAEEQQQLDELERQAATVKSPVLSSTTPLSETMGIPASYWLDLRGYDPVETAKTIKQPLLILQGERDYQVTMEDFARWRTGLAGSERATFKSYPDLNHLFVSGEGPSRPEEYQRPGHVAPQVIEDITMWIKQGI